MTTSLVDAVESPSRDYRTEIPADDDTFAIYESFYRYDSIPLEAFNFVPRVKVPTLMVNGRHDFFFPVQTSQMPMFSLLATPPADKRRREFASGHVPTERLEVIKEILDWLDRYLGVVSRSER